MTNLINQISINGETTTFLNYVNPLSGGEQILSTNDAWYNFFVQQLTSLRVARPTTERYNLRFNVPFETMTGQVIGNISNITSTSRCYIPFDAIQSTRANTTNTNTTPSNTIGGSVYISSASRPYTYAVMNNYALTVYSCANSSRSSGGNLFSIGWGKDTAFSGVQYPRGFYWYSRREDGETTFRRVTQENLTTMTNMSVTSSAYTCAIATPGADSTDNLLIDTDSPNWYTGKIWHTMRLPSTAVVGSIYRNDGLDPDTGQVETDQKAFWMCVGTWGTDKIGMRVWTENIT